MIQRVFYEQNSNFTEIWIKCVYALVTIAGTVPYSPVNSSGCLNAIQTVEPQSYEPHFVYTMCPAWNSTEPYLTQASSV